MSDAQSAQANQGGRKGGSKGAKVTPLHLPGQATRQEDERPAHQALPPRGLSVPGCRYREEQSQGRPGSWEGSQEDEEENRTPAGPRFRRDQQTFQGPGRSSQSPCPTSSFPCVKGEGQEAERKERSRKTKHSIDGSHPTSDRLNIYSSIHGPDPGGASSAWVTCIYAGVWAEPEVPGGQCLAQGTEFRA